MTEINYRQLGITNIVVPEICIGTSPLGGMPDAYGYDVSREEALLAMRAVFASPITFVDTSNEYSRGESERRIGTAVKEAGGLPEGFVLATKIDPAEGAESLPGERVRASLAESLDRLGVETVPLLYLHDPSRFALRDLLAPGGPVEALAQLKADGIVEAIGIADGDVAYSRALLDEAPFDVVLNHNRYTLLARSAVPLIEHARRNDIAFINAAPFGSGILGKGPDVHRRYAYVEAGDRLVETARRLQEACEARGVPLAAAALQFSTRDARIASTVVGISRAERVASLMDLLAVPMPDDLWTEIDEIVGVLA